jgi:hypothetical protein
VEWRDRFIVPVFDKVGRKSVFLSRMKEERCVVVQIISLEVSCGA